MVLITARTLYADVAPTHSWHDQPSQTHNYKCKPIREVRHYQYTNTQDTAAPIIFSNEAWAELLIEIPPADQFAVTR